MLDNPNDRLKFWIEKNFRNKSDFARKIGLNPVSLTPYLNGKSKLGGKFVTKLQEIGFDYEWYLTGKESKIEEVSQEEVSKFMTIPVSNYSAYANTGTIIADIQQEEEQEISLLNIMNIKGNVKAIRVNGNSMINEGIIDGSYIVYEATQNVPSGKLAIVKLNGLLMIKHLHFINNKFILRSANIEVADIKEQIDDKLEIIGLVKFSLNAIN